VRSRRGQSSPPTLDFTSTVVARRQRSGYIRRVSEPGERPLADRAAKWGAVAPLFLLPQPDVRMAVERNESLAREMERRVDELGFELVELEQAGSRARPILRAAIDRPDSKPGEPAVSLDDCTTVSRALEPWLDQYEGLSDRYVLEVSSPGVERPLVRLRDWERFAGAEVAVKGKDVLAGRAKRLEGVLLGLRGDVGAETVALRLPGDEEIEVPLAEIDRGNLVFRWERGGKGR
jgi:ribosome maturation factor RimP